MIDDLLFLYTQLTCVFLPMLVDEPEPHHNSVFTGRRMYVEELMNNRRTNDNRFCDVNRMDRRTFRFVISILISERIIFPRTPPNGVSISSL